ncbi:LysR family transcriptional regulator [Oricola indica]|uniref:LysR family transcriptional regulator n=1 Tax=Oricola indica TaxID=2872591 RepID=UPI003CCBD0DE
MIDKLEFFLALAREQHFGKAAQACNVSQPTLSASIKQLEDQLGVKLVQRGSRYQGLTPEGERVRDWARRIVGDARAMRMEIRAARHGLLGRVRIAAIPTALPMVRELTAAFHALHPGVTFMVLSRTSAEILELIDNLEVDVGITYLANEPLGRVSVVPLYEERYMFVTAVPELFAERPTVTWSEVSQTPLCLLTPDMQNRRIINHYFEEVGVEAKPVLESDSMIALVSHVLGGVWSSILPAKVAAIFNEAGTIRAIPLSEPDAIQMIGAVADEREPRTPVIEALLKCASTVAGRMKDF